jgi:hypothetical protein
MSQERGFTADDLGSVMVIIRQRQKQYGPHSPQILFSPPFLHKRAVIDLGMALTVGNPSSGLLL